jgi:hypothetical protein
MLLALLAVAVAVAAVVALRPAHEAPPVTDTTPQPTAAATALLGDLNAGSMLGDFEVESIVGPGAEGRDPQAILIHVRSGDARLAVTIMPRETSEHTPPMQTAAHDLFFGHLQPEEARLDPGATDALLTAVAELVRAHE